MKKMMMAMKMLRLFKRRQTIVQEYEKDGYTIVIYPTKVSTGYYEKWKHSRNGNILELKYNENNISLYINGKLKSKEQTWFRDA